MSPAGAGPLLTQPPTPSAAVLDAACVSAFVRAGYGSTFLPSSNPVTGRKRWILSLTPGGVVVIDDCAVAAVARGKSLFPSGVVSVAGQFDSQDAVSIQDARGQEIARALANYSSDDMQRVAGKDTKDLVEVLGYLGPEEAADHDNIVLLVVETPSASA
ncbi:hypothetical protein EON68_02395 [archaeon]|nr:MAG: hypothetical protein EON68_02395 [archaeon]